MIKRITPEKIFTGFQKNDISAFEKLYKIYYLRLIKYAGIFSENLFQAEDFVQEAFIEVWNKRDIFRNENQFSAYIFSTVKNKCLNSIKRKLIEENYLSKQLKLETEELYHISFGLKEPFVSMEEQLFLALEKVISEMPEKCSTAFRLKWIEGKKIREIAEIMEISTTMVDKHLAKGFQIAQKKLSPALILFLVLQSQNEIPESGSPIT